MTTLASQITSLTVVYSIVYSDTDQRKHQSSTSLAFLRGIYRGPVNSPHKWQVTRKIFPFDEVIMVYNDFDTIWFPYPWTHYLQNGIQFANIHTFNTKIAILYRATPRTLHRCASCCARDWLWRHNSFLPESRIWMWSLLENCILFRQWMKISGFTSMRLKTTLSDIMTHQLRTYLHNTVLIIVLLDYKVFEFP